MSELPTQEQAKRAYEVMSAAYVHLTCNVLLPAMKARARVEQTDEYDKAIAKLERQCKARM